MKSSVITLSISMLLSFVCFPLFAQKEQLVQTIRGIVLDESSGTPLPSVSVILEDNPDSGTFTDTEGQFVLNAVSLGRHTLVARFMGYEPVIIPELLFTSAKELFVEIRLKENVQELNEVIIRPKIEKDLPINRMAVLGAHMLRVEEASRYAGGMDDPARLVSSFAGVSPNVSTNGISVHGNAPSLLQWRLEGIEIPNPNHFADIATLGGGILSALSSHVLGNSDFFTGAFPAEYNNAVSGIFDMNLRNGNNRKFQHTFQAGVLGIDFASEGPLYKANNSSYIFNYRYSTTGLMNKLKLSSDLGGVLDYQDLNFKLNFPTRRAGIFSVWGMGFKDISKPDFEDNPDAWDYKGDAKASNSEQISGAGGLSHRLFLGDRSYLKTTIASTYSKNEAWEDQYDFQLVSHPYLRFYNRTSNLVITSFLNHKYNARHTQKTGFTITNLSYHLNLAVSPLEGQALQPVVQGQGSTQLFSAYTSSSMDLTDRVLLSWGLNGQYLTLNRHWTLEPRAGIKWQTNKKTSIGFAYGLHSRMEKLDVYFVHNKQNLSEPVNKHLDFIKSQHIMMSYNYRISDQMNLKIEPYFQYLYNVPVIADSSYSILNRTLFYVEEPLVNQGKGYNIGLDIELEKYLTHGLYYKLAVSLFNSRYRGGNGEWYHTRYNRNFIVNGLIGKEWMVGPHKKNILSVNLALTLQGGDRYSIPDEKATLEHPDKEVQYDETRPYSEQFSPMLLANYTVSYKINNPRTAHTFSVKGLNATGYKEYYGHEYNLKTGIIEPNKRPTSLFNLSYTLDF